MNSFRVIRVSGDYGLIVVVSPEDASPKDKNIKYYVYNSNYERKTLAEATAIEVMCYFSGHADGMGWGKLPEKPFESLAAVEAWRKKEEKKYKTEFLKKNPG